MGSEVFPCYFRAKIFFGMKRFGSRNFRMCAAYRNGGEDSRWKTGVICLPDGCDLKEHVRGLLGHLQ